ncbi:hypothetical protein SDC49_04400 [Lactobacillus sp. R2/2]|nr:hypothetical protein [Lactobacillus sp. R2/2]
MLGIVLNVSTAARETCGNDEYINGSTEEICGAIININDIDNKAHLNNPDLGLTFFILIASFYLILVLIIYYSLFTIKITLSAA